MTTGDELPPPEQVAAEIAALGAQHPDILAEVLLQSCAPDDPNSGPLFLQNILAVLRLRVKRAELEHTDAPPAPPTGNEWDEV